MRNLSLAITRLAAAALVLTVLVFVPIISQAETPAPVPVTGQTRSANSGDDGDLKKGVAWPIPRFTDNTDGTVTDNLTGLIWLKNANCSGQASLWDRALLNIWELNFTGEIEDVSCGDTSNGGSHQDDWRLPNKRELLSLIDFGGESPALEANHPFTNVQPDFSYWTSTTSAADTTRGWVITISSSVGIAGELKDFGKFAGGIVWPVRGSTTTSAPGPVPKTGQTVSYAPVAGDDAAYDQGIAWPDPRFRDNGNGTVTDCLTSLVWVKDLTCDELKDPNHLPASLTTVNNLGNGQCGLTDDSQGGGAWWRLPNVRELESLIHAGFSNPALPNTPGTGQWTSGDPFVFVTGQQSEIYWTSTLYGESATNFSWTVNLGAGGLTSENNGSPNYVWPVRDATQGELCFDVDVAFLPAIYLLLSPTP